MFIAKQVSPHLKQAMVNASSDEQRQHLSFVLSAINSRTPITAGVKPLNRYSIQQGKTFGKSTGDKEKYKVLRVLADDIVIKNTRTEKVETFQVDRLLKDWSAQGIQEVSSLDEIIQTVKNLLGPALGIFLTTSLIAWLSEKLR